MNYIMKPGTYFSFFLYLCCLVLFSPALFAQEPMAPVAGLEDEPALDPDSDTADTDIWTNLVYFTGIGCPHCSNTDPVVLRKRLRKGDVMVFEYEIYQDSVNRELLMEYNKAYGARLAVPQIIAGPDKESGIVSGDAPVLNSLNALIKMHKGNGILLSDEEVPFEQLSFIKLPYKPKIWFKNRVAIREDGSSLQDEKIKTFLLEGSKSVPEECAPQEGSSVPLSGGKIEFMDACRFDGWVLMYD